MALKALRRKLASLKTHRVTFYCQDCGEPEQLDPLGVMPGRTQHGETLDGVACRGLMARRPPREGKAGTSWVLL